MPLAPIPRHVRLAAMLCDHTILCALLIPPLIWWEANWEWEFELLLFFYLNKDFVNGRSPAKRLFRLQVVDREEQPANELRCLVRNMTVFLWPLEVLVLLLGRRDRFGDTLAGTHVKQAPVETTSWWQDVQAYRFTRSALYTLATTLAYVLLVHAFGTKVLGL